MSQRFRNSSRQFAGAVMVAAVLAGVGCITTSGLANVSKFATTSVDRTHKGDRLSPASSLARRADKSESLRCRQLCRQGVIRHLVRLLTRTVDGYSADVLH